MPLRIFRRPGSKIYSYRGAVAGRKLRGSTGTTDKVRAERIAAEREADEWKCRLDGPEAVLTFAKASMLYRAGGGEARFLPKIEDYWKDTLVRHIKPGMIRQMAIDLYPDCSGATRNRQAIVPALAVTNHCSELGLCPPLRMKRFKVETKIKKPVTLEWINAFRAHADRADVAALALFMFATGARVSEALAVRWDDIDFKARKVLIRQTKLGNERRAHLPTDLFLALANLARDKEPFGIAYTTAREAWDRTTRAAGIEPLTFHSCRHGFATSLHDKGVGVKTIAKAGGWKSAQHLFNTYLHAAEDATVTDRLFSTEETQPVSKHKSKQ